MKYKQELPAEVEAQLDSYIERIKSIKWFKPASTLDKEQIEKQVNISLKAFGIEAGIEYRQLKTPDDWDAAWGAAWDAARDAAWGAAWDAAWGAARDAARDAAWGAARDAARDAAWGAAWDAARDAAWDAAWGAARDAARDAAWGAADILAMNLDGYKEKYPNGNFINLIPIYEMGLWPIGVVDGKFVIAIPPIIQEFPEIK